MIFAHLISLHAHLIYLIKAQVFSWLYFPRHCIKRVVTFSLQLHQSKVLGLSAEDLVCTATSCKLISWTSQGKNHMHSFRKSCLCVDFIWSVRLNLFSFYRKVYLSYSREKQMIVIFTHPFYLPHTFVNFQSLITFNSFYPKSEN